MADYKGNADLPGQKRLRALERDRFPWAHSSGQRRAESARARLRSSLLVVSRCLADCTNQLPNQPRGSSVKQTCFYFDAHLWRDNFIFV